MLDKLGLTPAALTTLQAVPHPLFTVQKNSILTCLLSLVNRSNVMAALLARRVRVNQALSFEASSTSVRCDFDIVERDDQRYIWAYRGPIGGV
jgi:hypothetical protein